MYAIHNENYGYSVATYGDYVAIGNPPFLSSVTSGSVSVKKYNYSTDTNSDYLVLYKKYNSSTSTNDDFGHSVSIYSNDLAVSSRYYTASAASGSSVDIFDLSTTSTSSYFSISSSYNDESGSFGDVVSLGNNIIAIGCSKKYNNKGAVYIYSKNGSSWNYVQTLTGSNSVSGDYFGISLKIDPSGSNQLIVGNSSSVSPYGTVYIFESSSLGWNQTAILNADRNYQYELPYYQLIPSNVTSQTYDNYGYSVSIYGDKAIVGCPNESQYYEYTDSSNLIQRGSVFLYYKCNITNKWVFDSKFYDGKFDANQPLLKNNKLGFSVDVFENFAVASSLKLNFPFSTSYITQSLNQVLFDESTYNLNTCLGYVYLYQYVSSSWSPKQNLSKIKSPGKPHTVFGYDVSLSDKSIVVGSPCLLLNTGRYVTESISNYTNIHGYSYYYNFSNLTDNHHIGNIFYRNGEMVLKTSGSLFDKLMITAGPYKYPLPYYNVKYNSQITLHENQTICEILPGEFNVSTNPTAVYRNTFTYDINQDKKFNFQDVDLMLRYMCNLNLGNEQWWNVVIENEYETSLFNYYSGLQSDVQNAPISRTVTNYFSGSLLTSQYTTYLNNIKSDLDIDGNGAVNINDMFILWKYFSHQLTDNIYKTLVTPKSTRSKYTDVISYLDTETSKINPSYIKPEFFNYQYSSSIDNTGSFLAPYITTVGLYSGTDLVAIGKLGTPIKNSGDFPINILVKWDV